MRFLFGEPQFINTLDPNRDSAPAFRIENDELRLTERLEQSRIARECADWIRRKVEVRSIRYPSFLHGKMYHIQQGDYVQAVLGSSNFTTRGLGLGEPKNIELNFRITDQLDQEDLKAWFDQVWSDEKLVADVKNEVLKYLERLYVPYSPQFIYFKTLFHLFDGFEADQQVALKQSQHLFESEIWQTLFEFQQDGAQAAIRKLQKHGGCILADSVGLGKTYTALAVIKYFENLNDRVLVLSPKKLRENWTLYRSDNNSPLNPFLRDRFAYTVLSHTDLSRDSGMVGDVNLATLNWGNYDLVVIDESHNFRNNTKGRRDEEGQVIRRSRYERLMEDIMAAGVRTKVLMLSATPVNNSLADLRNQLMIVANGKDDGFFEKVGISSLKDLLAVAQREFNGWAEKSDRNAEVLLERLGANVFALLDELTLARSRDHVRRYYPETMQRLGGFPNRQTPISINAEVDTRGLFPSYEGINNQITGYKLSLFNPFRYVLPEHVERYDRDNVANFSQGKRESYLIGMMKVNFLKRLESSVHSFAVTLERTVEKIQALKETLEAFVARDQQGALESLQPDAFDDDELLAASQIGERVKYDLRHLNVSAWLNDLRQDEAQLSAILEVSSMITPVRDAKLTELKALITQKVKHPTRNKRDEPNRKVIVFTAFADTASYLYRELQTWARETLGVHAALVVGTGENATTLGSREYNAILTNFSPRAKGRDRLPGMLQDEEINLLIATDCISEGQNLQDCDYLVNYDIHWNPVRLIQRFGRIDRIGSLNTDIQMVNFWPTDDLNAYLNLKNRVEARMALVDLTATGKDNPLTPEQAKTELSYRDQQLLRLKDEVLDLEELTDSVTLADFSLDDFRIDLSNFLQANREALRDAPQGLLGIVEAPVGSEIARAGVIFCLRQRVNASEKPVNPLHPHFLVYIRDDGTVRFSFTQAKQILELYRGLCAGKGQAEQALHDVFDIETQNGKDVSRYSDLLHKSLASIEKSFKTKVQQSLFAGRGAVVPKRAEQVSSETEFDLVTWLVIRDAADDAQAVSL